LCRFPERGALKRAAYQVFSTILLTCGWCVIAEPQVWTTEVMPMRAPKCLRSAEKLVVNIP
jgi:hypothetical protein